MATHTTWSNWFINHANNNAGNQNLKDFSKILSSNDNDGTKLRQLFKKIDTVILAADANNCIMILHSPKNFGGTQTQPKNKADCMLGMGTQAVSVLVDYAQRLQTVTSSCPLSTNSQDAKQLKRPKTSQSQRPAGLSVLKGQQFIFQDHFSETPSSG